MCILVRDKNPKSLWFKPLWPSDVICRLRYGSLLAQVMAWWHQAITWSNFDVLLLSFCSIDLRAISQWVPKLLLCVMSLKIVLIKFLHGYQWVKIPRKCFCSSALDSHWQHIRLPPYCTICLVLDTFYPGLLQVLIEKSAQKSTHC